jgi:hypothetical protein
MAWDLIGAAGGLDTPGMLTQLLVAHRSGLMTTGAVYGIASRHLLLNERPDGPRITVDDAPAWLAARLAAGKTYGDIVLEGLDQKMSPASFNIRPGDATVQRFLNRIDGEDVDEWLGKRAPGVNVFRHAQVSANGSDPAITLTRHLMAYRPWEGEVTSAIAAVYPDPEDQKACEAMVAAIFQVHDRIVLGRSPSERHLRDWYWAKRSQMVYDPERHRVVILGTKASSPTPME